MQVKINENKSIDVVGIKAKQLSIVLTKFKELTARAKEDESVAAALSGISYIFNDKPNKAVLVQLVPQMLATFYDEFLDIMTQLFPLTKDEVDNMDLDVVIEVISALIQETDFPKIADLLKKFLIPQK